MNNKILIVEDEFIVANSLRLILQQAGYYVNGIAASAEEANENIRKNKPDLVILDIHLKGKQSGIDLAKKLKAENIAFVYLSANSNQEVLEEAKTTEPYGFLIKPFREKELLVMLDIARYRHKHSYESKLRQEEHLLDRLTAISNEALDAKQILMKVARVLQPQIPFDLILSAPGPIDSEPFNHTGYLRTGFDDYQYIGEKELMTIAGLKKENGQLTQLPKILFEYFRIVSHISVPLTLSNGTLVHYYFYSRQHDIYNQSHTGLLNRLKTCLAVVTEKMIYGRPEGLGKNHNDPAKDSGLTGIIGNHPLLLAALDLTTQVAPYNTSVLILGESGTGKERIAQAVHALSPRKNGPFIKVNCAAIPGTLIESELFGHEKGAFTGATEKRKGRFEQADGGTIFLDEIGELSLDMQVKLLRVLQEKEINLLGGSSTTKVNVRIVAATNRNLEKEIAEGNFRLDLYYRLNVFPITLPSLRERKSDITALALFFANKFCKEFHKEFTGISTSMMEQMYAYHWPGNIRELENVLERTVILHDGKSELALKQDLTGTVAELSAKGNIETLDDVKRIQQKTEKVYILSVLKKAGGRIRGVNGAAELLNIKPTTLESKMAKLGIKKEDL